MKYRQLGNSELQVSEIALGSWLTYGAAVDNERAHACLRQAIDSGINFIDTANVYAKGSAETFLGQMLAEYRRQDYILATKLYFPMSETDRGLSAQQIHKQIDESLQRLRTDHVDLYQCHRYDEDTPLDETMHALTEVVRAGKARYIGFSEWSPEQIRSALSVRDAEAFVSSQPQYSMLWRKPEQEVMPLCARNGIRQIVWSPLAQGVLSGKYRPGDKPPSDSRAADNNSNIFMRDLLTDPILRAVGRLEPIAESLQITLAQLALAWVLREENVAAAIVGASRPSQVRENAAASGIELSAETLRRIDTALGDAVLS